MHEATFILIRKSATLASEILQKNHDPPISSFLLTHISQKVESIKESERALTAMNYDGHMGGVNMSDFNMLEQCLIPAKLHCVQV